MAGKRRQLPVLEGPAETSASCGAKAYVSLEESTLLAAIRAVRERAEPLRAALATEQNPAARGLLQARLDELRQERRALVARRERAYVRKMVMLGHLPPEELDEDEA